MWRKYFKYNSTNFLKKFMPISCHVHSQCKFFIGYVMVVSTQVCMYMAIYACNIKFKTCFKPYTICKRMQRDAVYWCNKILYDLYSILWSLYSPPFPLKYFLCNTLKYHKQHCRFKFHNNDFLFYFVHLRIANLEKLHPPLRYFFFFFKNLQIVEFYIKSFFIIKKAFRNLVKLELF